LVQLQQLLLHDETDAQPVAASVATDVLLSELLDSKPTSAPSSIHMHSCSSARQEQL